jgi:hypothetical protein
MGEKTAFLNERFLWKLLLLAVVVVIAVHPVVPLEHKAFVKQLHLTLPTANL